MPMAETAQAKKTQSLSITSPVAQKPLKRSFSRVGKCGGSSHSFLRWRLQAFRVRASEPTATGRSPAFQIYSIFAAWSRLHHRQGQTKKTPFLISPDCRTHLRRRRGGLRTGGVRSASASRDPAVHRQHRERHRPALGPPSVQPEVRADAPSRRHPARQDLVRLCALNHEGRVRWTMQSICRFE